MKALQVSFLSCALLLFTSVTAQAVQLASAKAVEVTGTVTKYNAGGGNVKLKAGDILREGDSISVTAVSMARLVFSNGSELTVEENTSIEISKLQQEAFAGNKSYEQLQADPSQSQTILQLNYGRVEGHVKKLREDSKFHVNTPLGTAAIRGTRFTTLLIYNAERQEFFLSVKNRDGIVDIMSRYAGAINYGQGNIGDKSYDSTISEEVREVIPKDHTVILRLGRGDRYYDVLMRKTKQYIPSGPPNVVTPHPEEDDLGVIVVSPEGAKKTSK